jgi:alanine-synthesizing transaminase
MGGAAAGRLDVRLVADPEPFKTLGSVEFSKLLVEKAEVRCRRAPASASAARASCASRWWRTSSASGRPRATSAGFLKSAPEKLHNVVPLATRR